MTDVNWEYITGSVATIFGTAYAFYKKQSRKRFEKGLIEALTDKIEINEILSNLKHDVKAPRVVMLETKNGGGIPTGNKPVYISIFDEVPDYDVEPIKDMVQNLPTDNAYNKLLLRMLKKSNVFIETATMEKGLLKEFYVSGGIQCAYIQRIGSYENKFFYISISWKHIITMDVGIESSLRTSANNIYNVLIK